MLLAQYNCPVNQSKEILLMVLSSGDYKRQCYVSVFSYTRLTLKKRDSDKISPHLLISSHVMRPTGHREWMRATAMWVISNIQWAVRKDKGLRRSITKTSRRMWPQFGTMFTIKVFDIFFWDCCDECYLLTASRGFLCIQDSAKHFFPLIPTLTKWDKCCYLHLLHGGSKALTTCSGSYTKWWSWD